MLAETYMSAVTDSLAGLAQRTEEFKRAAGRIVDTALDGGKIFVHDRLGIIDAEMTDRASGLALFRRLSRSRTEPANGDIVILSSFFPDQPAEIGMRDTLREKGVFVMAVAPEGSLTAGADLALINGLAGENGVITVPGIRRPFCPTSGIVNTAILWSVAAETVSLFLERNMTPTVFWGEHLDEGAEHREQAIKQFATRGY